jgi:hypothetical protein
MTMTYSERQWLTRVMRTVAYMAVMEPGNAVDRPPVRKDAGEDVLRAARKFVEVLQRGNDDRVEGRPLEGLGDHVGWR